MLKTALVTGASRGIGAAVAKGLAADGYQVAGVYCHSRDAMEKLAAACGVIPIAADLSQTDALPELAETVLEHLGHVDVLVNNAACSYINLFQCLPPEQVRRLYAVNLTAPVELSRLLLPSMLSRHAGCIVNISSMWGETGASCEVDYSVDQGGDSGVYPCTGEGTLVPPAFASMPFRRGRSLRIWCPTCRRKHWTNWQRNTRGRLGNRKMWQMSCGFWCPNRRRISPDRIFL